MTDQSRTAGLQRLTLLGVMCYAVTGACEGGTNVSGTARMTDTCSPAVSPAVVYLVPQDASDSSSSSKELFPSTNR